LVLVEPAKTEAPKAEEPTTEEPKPEPREPEEIAPVLPEASAEPIPQTTAAPEPEPVHPEPVAEETSSEEERLEAEKPALIRGEILEAKKLVLLDLSKAYKLDPTGTKEQLRERLLSYLDEQEANKQPQEALVQPEVAPATLEPVAVPPSAPAPTAAPAAEPTKSPAKLISAAPRMVPEIARRQMPPQIPAESAGGPAIVAPQPSAPIVVEAYAPPVVTAPPSEAATITEAPAVPVTRVEHPCPRCGRELTYIPQYNRWYCYSCRAYAPRARSKFACPNCGAPLRWISQYERWWCDACRRYAPADLPKPGRTTLAEGSAVGTSRPLATIATPAVQQHRNPETGIGLVGFGMVLFVVYEILVDLPASLSGGSLLGPDVAFGLRFFAGVFLAVGVILGLYAVRDRR
jgi:predicted RNA-binding Zn-ribbon protein involved in translation (DUF1610 family)